MWIRSWVSPNAQVVEEPPERWPTRAAGLYRAHPRSDADKWVDVCGTRWAEAHGHEHPSFHLISWAINPAAGAMGVEAALRKLRCIVGGLNDAGIADGSAPSSVYASSNIYSSSSPQASQYMRPQFVDPSGVNAGPDKHSSAQKYLSTALPTRPYPFEEDWETVHHPCVIHLQGVSREGYHVLLKNDWVKRQFSITAGLLAELGGGWPANASYGNVTLVSHALCVPAKPYLLYYMNSDPSTSAHAVFVTVRITLISGEYRHILLCNTALEPDTSTDDKTRQQFEQMRAISFHLFTPTVSSADATGMPLNAGVFAGRAQRGILVSFDHLTLVDATERLRYQANGRILHTAKDGLHVDIGTVGEIADIRMRDHNLPGGLAAKIWFESAASRLDDFRP